MATIVNVEELRVLYTHIARLDAHGAYAAHKQSDASGEKALILHVVALRIL